MSFKHLGGTKEMVLKHEATNRQLYHEILSCEENLRNFIQGVLYCILLFCPLPYLWKGCDWVMDAALFILGLLVSSIVRKLKFDL